MNTILPPLPPLREVIAAHGLSASKALGQNFLFDEQLLDRIANIAAPQPGQTVYEVGPGPGGLTRALLRTGADVVAVERDARCLPPLEELRTASGERLTIIAGDALKIDEASTLPDGHLIVANLPYNVGTALLIRWLEAPVWPPRWASLTLMFQREVAERIIAKTDTSAYGRLAVLSQWRSTPTLAMKVHRSAFTPPPKVMSAVIHIVPAAQPAGAEPARLSQITAAAFGQRRKMLRQSLRSVPAALAALEQVGIDPTRRAETLSVDEFVKLARASA